MILFYIYNIFSYLGAVIVPIIIKIRIKNKKEDIARVNERYGYPSKIRPIGELIWIHAVSVGETNSILPLIKELILQGKNILLTTSSLGSVNFLKNKLPEKAIHQMLPLDCPIFIKRFLKHWNPDTTIFVESEIWPNTFYYASVVSRLYIINAYIPNKAYNIWAKYAKSLLVFTLNQTTKIFTSTLEMQKKLIKLVPTDKVQFLNHTKYDAAIESTLNIQILMQINNRFVIIFASTHAGEEEIAIKTHIELKQKIPNLVTIIAPRHLHRMNSIRELCSDLKVVIYPENNSINNNTDIVLINEIGNLMSFYKISDIAVVCGSLVPNIGGHNPLEPASLGKSIIIGKYNDSCKETCDDLLKAKGILICQDSQDLLVKIIEIIDKKHPQIDQNALNFVINRSGSSKQIKFDNKL